MQLGLGYVHLVDDTLHIVVAYHDGRPEGVSQYVVEPLAIGVQQSETSRVRSELLISLKRQQVVEGAIAQHLCCQGEWPNRGETHHEVGHLILVDEIEQPLCEQRVRERVLIERPDKIFEKSIDIAAAPLNNPKTDAFRQEKQEWTYHSVEKFGRLLKVVTRSIAEHSLLNSRVRQFLVPFHHPIDRDLVTTTVQRIGERKIAHSGTKIVATAHRDESETL